VEKRIKPAIEAAQEMAVARGNSAIAAVGYFSEGRFNLRVVGLNVETVLEPTAIWAGWLLRTIRRGKPVNGYWVKVFKNRPGSTDEIRKLICSKLEA